MLLALAYAAISIGMLFLGGVAAYRAYTGEWPWVRSNG